MVDTNPKKQRTGGSAIDALRMDTARYTALLSSLVGEAERLQNNPAQNLYPQEDEASKHVLAALAPHTLEQGGPLRVERVSFIEGRGNVIITYPGEGEGSVAFVGAHMDVVPANPENWSRDPFALSVEGDELHGRGTTDCLGHVALLTELMLQLAVSRPALQRTVTAILIANEENGFVENIGVDRLMASGKMDHLKSGPVIWVDSADSQPCIGTAGSVTWTLKATGKLFHSGLPHKGINALELANAAVAKLQDHFYEAFPPVEGETTHKFMTPSTMKPTQVRCAVGSLNQLPPWVEISGDVRLTPFYEVEALKASLEAKVADFNADLPLLPTRGPVSRYEIEGARGKLELTFGAGHMEGIACTLDTEGNAALVAATKRVLGEAKPYSICGSLPLVRDLQRGGFDVQITGVFPLKMYHAEATRDYPDYPRLGFGLMKTYHADNEFCLLSDMEKGFRILLGVVDELEP